MAQHLSTLQVKQLCASSLSEDELSAAAQHCAECQSCDQRFVAELKRQRGSAPFTFTLEPEFWFRHDHVDFEQLVALADKSLDQETEEIINIHLSTCETCREDVRSFLTFRDATASDPEISHRPEYEATHEVAANGWWQHLQSRPAYAMAAIVLLAVAVFIGVVALNRRFDPLEASKQDQTNPGIDPSPGISGSPAPNVIASPSSVDAAKVAILNDAGGEVTIDRNGSVTGLEGVSENSRRYVAQAALSEQIEPADVLRRLAGEQSGLRGDDEGRPGFRLLYPARTVVIEDRPVFRWESLPGVSSYQVYLLDADGKQVSQSGELPPTRAHWKAPAPLRRGQVFSWVVTALVDGEKVVSPSASAPEMKFAVLSTADTRELSGLKKSDSHLALGVFYARAGLLHEAEREFQILSKLNPDSELPGRLLQSVRDIKQGK